MLLTRLYQAVLKVPDELSVCVVQNHQMTTDEMNAYETTLRYDNCLIPLDNKPWSLPLTARLKPPTQ